MADEYPKLDELLGRNTPPQWDIRLPFDERLKQIISARDAIKKDWRAALDDDDISGVDTGVLLGALNLITDLLKGAGIPVPDDDEE